MDHAARRSRLLDALGPRGVAVFFAHPTSIRNNDVEHDYRQDSDLYYLTGFEEPACALVVSAVHPEHRTVMFLRDRDPEREVWDGGRLGVEAAPERLGVDAALAIGDLGKKLPGYLEGADRLVFALGRDPTADRQMLRALQVTRARHRKGIEAPLELVDPAAVLHEHRLVKDDDELARMRRAAEITAEAHRAGLAVARPGRFEYEVDAEIGAAFRRLGAARPAYGSIVGSGPNATILHYRANDREMASGELLLVDAGCEYQYYAADVTRTSPIDGRFSGEQRAVYEVVLAAQKAAIDAVRVGSNLEAVHQAGLEVTVDGLRSLGVLDGDRDELIADEAYRPFFMHRTSHWLGMDVHDVGLYFRGGEPRPLAPGQVFTVEPGLYVPVDATAGAARFAGIGVRIEDDVLVREDGVEILTAAVPKEIDDVEAALRDR